MKQKSISKLKKEADRLFSIFIRTSQADMFGLVRCFTCGKQDLWKNMHNGHYISRSWSNLRYDVQNCHPQCPGCNIFKKGNMDEYALALKRKYGDDILELLNKRKRPTQFKRKNYDDLIAKYS